MLETKIYTIKYTVHIQITMTTALLAGTSCPRPQLNFTEMTTLRYPCVPKQESCRSREEGGVYHRNMIEPPSSRD